MYKIFFSRENAGEVERIADYIHEVVAKDVRICVVLRGETTLRFNAGVYRRLASLPEGRDGRIDSDGVMWIGGTGHPVSKR